MKVKPQVDGDVQFNFSKPSDIDEGRQPGQKTEQRTEQQKEQQTMEQKTEQQKDSLRPPVDSLPVFYFSPTLPASDIESPVIVASEETTRVEYTFTPLPVASHTKRSSKPVRPITVRMPTGEFCIHCVHRLD